MNTVLREIRDGFTTRLSGAVDRVMFSHSDSIKVDGYSVRVLGPCKDFSFYFLFCYISHISNIFSTTHSSLDC